MSIATVALHTSSFLAARVFTYVAPPLGLAFDVSGRLGLGGQGGGGGWSPSVCPQAPPGAQAPTDQLTGYVLWGVLILFVMGLIIGLGAVVAGRVFSMPHASKAGVVGVVVVLIAAVAYLVLPSMLDGILGDGCV